MEVLRKELAGKEATQPSAAKAPETASEPSISAFSQVSQLFAFLQKVYARYKGPTCIRYITNKLCVELL